MSHQKKVDCGETRCLWFSPWWHTEKVPPVLSPEELDPKRDICREQIGASPLVMGRRLLIRAPMLENRPDVMISTELNKDNESKKIQLGLVIAVGRHAFPPSETYGSEGWQVFCQPGDWVEYAYWEKTESILNKNSLEGDKDQLQLYYVNDLHVNSVIRPEDYPIILGNRC